MRTRILALAFALLSTGALAQTAVKQSGTVTPNQVPWWISSGVIGGGVTSADSPISSFGVTNNGFNGICTNSQRITAAGRQTLCMGVTDSGGGRITLQNYGTDTAQPFQFVINGSTITPAGGITALTVGSTTIGNGIATGTLYDNGGVLGNLAAGNPVFNVEAYGSISAAVAAMLANKGGVVWIPCGTYSLGSGSVGINLDDATFPVRITGPGNAFGGPANKCVQLIYFGAGTMISARSNPAVEIDHLYLFASNNGSAQTVINLAHSATGSDTILSNIHDNLINIQYSNANNIGIDLDDSESAVIKHNIIGSQGGCGIRGVSAAGHYAVGAVISDQNEFSSGNATAICAPGETWTVAGNTIEGIPAISAGPSGTCKGLTFSGNWIGDFGSAGVTIVDSNCSSLFSSSNRYANGPGGIAIKQENSTGNVTSISDFFDGTTGIAIGTGNSLSFLTPSTTNLSGSIVTGTPLNSDSNSAPTAFYGTTKFSKNTTLPPATGAFPIVSIVGADGSPPATMTIQEFGAGSQLGGVKFYNAGGTAASPTAAQSGDRAGAFFGYSYATSASPQYMLAAGAGVVIENTETCTTTACGAKLELIATPTGTAVGLLGATVGTGFMVGGGGVADPGVSGVINLGVGVRIGNAAASGNVLRGNGTNFVSAQLSCADLSSPCLPLSGGTMSGPIAMGTNAITGLTTLAGSGTLTFQSNGSTFAGSISTAQQWEIGANVAADASLTINNNTVATVALPSGSNPLHLVGSDTAETNLTMDAFGASTGNVIFARVSGGTAASKTATATSQLMLAFGGQSWDGSAYTTNSAIFFNTVNAQTGSDHSSVITFRTTPTGSATVAEAGRFGPSGGLSVGVTTDAGIGNLLLNGILKYSSAPTAVSGAGPILIGSASTINSRMKVNLNGTDYWIPVSTTAF